METERGLFLLVASSMFWAIYLLCCVTDVNGVFNVWAETTFVCCINMFTWRLGTWGHLFDRNSSTATKNPAICGIVIFSIPNSQPVVWGYPFHHPVGGCAQQCSMTFGAGDCPPFFEVVSMAMTSIYVAGTLTIMAIERSKHSWNLVVVTAKLHGFMDLGWFLIDHDWSKSKHHIECCRYVAS